MSCRETLGKLIRAHMKGPVVVTDSHPTIQYTMTPERFVLEIPVEALANLSQESHTRMLAMLSEWILRHKPVKVENKP